MYVSFNDGTSWQSLQLNLPIVQVADMVIKEQELVVATHGRSFWILDDITPLHQIDEAMSKTAFLFESKDAYRRRTGFTAYYNLTDVPEDGIKLELLDSNGKVIQTFSSKDDESVPTKRGMNRFVWNLRYPAADAVDDAFWFGGRNAGPLAVPGTYQAKLTVGESTHTVSFEVKKDPRLETAQADFQEQFDLAIQIRDEITRLTDAIRRIRNVRGQVENLSGLLSEAGYEDDFAAAATSLNAKLTALEEKLMQTKNEAGPDTSNFPPRLDSQLIRVSSLVNGSEHRPTDGDHARFDDLKIELDAYLEELQGVLDEDLVAFKNLLAEKSVTPVISSAKR